MRCSKCLMPSSLPNSNFNQSNECSWCQSDFPNYSPKGTEKLGEILDQHRIEYGSADCLVGVSGGKDSSYVVMELQRTFGMKVEAFTYAHDGLKPFALQNAKKVCEKLGVKHHNVSIPGNKHLETFKSFFNVWMKSPTLLTANLSCVACKHLHILGTELAIKRKIPMVVWGMIPLENPPLTAIDREGVKDIEQGNMLKNAMLFAKEILNSMDLFKAVMSHFSTCFYGCMAVSPTTSYIKLRYPSVKQILFFDYVDWKPHKMIESLVANAGWEPPTKVATDWHYDCIFSAIKSYMFQKTLGITYMDAFLSNQIRYGLISRKEAWDTLVASKKDAGDRLVEALYYLGLSHLIPKIDTHCFDILEE